MTEVVLIETDECNECGGLGYFEIGPKCGYRCDWCGGCHDESPCHACDGAGDVEVYDE